MGHCAFMLSLLKESEGLLAYLSLGIQVVCLEVLHSISEPGKADLTSSPAGSP